MMLGPFWLISVFIMATERENEQVERGEKPVGSLRIRIKGMLVLALGVAAWFYGAFHFSIPKSQEAVLLVIAMYGILLGSYWSISGRKILE